MTPEETKRYLGLAVLLSLYDIDANGVDVVATRIMRKILKRLILRGACIHCALCGQPITREGDLSLDHIVPRSLGGSDYLHNMQPAHRKSNELKGNTVNQEDIATVCSCDNDSKDEILQRKKKRKSAGQKKRNVKHIKPWQIDKSNYGR